MRSKKEIIEKAEEKYIEILNRLSGELVGVDYLTRLKAAKIQGYEWLKTINDPAVEDISCRAIRRLGAVYESVYYSLGLDHNGTKIGPALDDFIEVGDPFLSKVKGKNLN